MTLEGLALSRATLDRAAHRRVDEELARRLLGEARTRVLLLVGGLAPVLDDGAGPRLVLVDGPAAAPLAQDPVDPPLLLFLGEEDGGTPGGTPGGPPHLAVSWPAERPTGVEIDAADQAAVVPEGWLGGGRRMPAGVPRLGWPAGTHWAGLRELGSLLDDRDAGLLTAAVALGAWHATHPYCARCGARTGVTQAGWVRSCPRCGADHYPRTDPAVIMAVEDPAGRLLLGRQATWPDKRFSTLAGFVEPGEALEAAVRREVAEEAGVGVGAVTYRGSQPWPFPSSLMLGFRAVATSTGIAVDGTELAEARWWSRAELAADVGAGRVLLPPRVSIARRLIEDWFGGELAAEEAWR